MLKPEPGDYFKLGEQDRAMSDMFRATVCQAIRDLDMGRSAGDQNPEKIAIELDSAQWLGTEDFETCCVCAFIDPVELLSQLRELVRSKPPYRRFLLRKLADLLSEPPLKPQEHAGMLEYGLADETDLEPSD